MSVMFLGGPLQDGKDTTIHALHVYLYGDGMHTIGWYEQVRRTDGTPSGWFEWHEKDRLEGETE